MGIDVDENDLNKLNAFCHELKNSLVRARNMVRDLCRPKGTAGAREWIMSIPARPGDDPDLVIGDALMAAERMLSTVKHLELEICLLRNRAIGADKMAAAIDFDVYAGLIRTRTSITDWRERYGNPFSPEEARKLIGCGNHPAEFETAQRPPLVEG